MSIAALPQNQSEFQSNAILASYKQRAEIEELDVAIGRLSRQMNACNYQLLVLIREFDERAGWLKWGCTDAVAWLRWRCDLSANAARDKLRVAHALKTLPAMSSAFKRGVLSYSKVRSLTRIANQSNEQELIDIATNISAANVEAHCRQRLNTSKAATNDANWAHDNRAFRIWRNEKTGQMNLSIELSIEDGALFEQAVEKAAVQLSSKAVDEPDKLHKKKASWQALQADAAMLIVREYLSEAKQPSASEKKKRNVSSADLYQVVVHVDEKALVNGASDSVSGTSGQSEMPVDTVRRLCCDGSIVPIIESAKGEPLNVGRKVRTITTAIRRALWSRDNGCVFPGCECKRYVDAHHIKHWADGGATDLNNLVLLCSKHHRLVHEGGYSIEFDQSNTRYFRRPDGRVIPENGYRLDDWHDTDSEELM